MQSPGNKLLAAALATAVAFTARPAVAAVGPEDVTSEQVQTAVRRGVGYLRRQQNAGGRWSYGGHPTGCTALTLLAMLNAGVAPDDPQVAAGIEVLYQAPDEQTYDTALKCQVYGALLARGNRQGQPELRAKLQAAADFLARAQLPSGMWSYTATHGGGDNSNTQFALLGLHEADKAGAHVPREVWTRARAHFLQSQTADGGWGYVPLQQPYGSMTAGGVSSLFIAGHEQHVAREKAFRDGAYLYCGRYRQDTAVAGGLMWLARRFDVRQNPGKGRQWLYYYLYGIERVGMLSGQQHLGPYDWYRRGAAFLVGDQQADGSWGRANYQTALAVLFLAKGNRPVLIQKLQWPGQWNRNIHDLENLCAFIDGKFAKPVSWQSVEFSQPLDELRQGPILFLTGHECPNINEPQLHKLRRFIESGGTLLAEACCGSEEFAQRFRRIAAELYPEYPLRPLGGDHPVFSSYYRLGDTYGLEGIEVGCRTAVFFSPKALSALWELETVPQLSQQAFELGTNIAAYATGRETLIDRLDSPVLAPPAEPTAAIQPTATPRGTVRLARLLHDGDAYADPHALVNLAEMLRDEARVNVVTRERALRATDEAIFDHPVLFMTGHYAFELSEEELDALRTYLRRGGVLFADACCGRRAFDESFRRMIERLLPENPLAPLAGDHPIYTGLTGAPLGELRYRTMLAEELGARGVVVPPATPAAGPLEGVTLDGRTAVIYSRYDFSCGLEGDNPFSSRGYVDEDARRLALAIVLFAIAY